MLFCLLGITFSVSRYTVRISTKSDFYNLSHLLSGSLYSSNNLSIYTSLILHIPLSLSLALLSPDLLLPARLHLSFMPSAVKWRMLAPAETSAGAASVLRVESVLEVSDLALFQANDSTIATTVTNIFCKCCPSIKMGFYSFSFANCMSIFVF